MMRERIRFAFSAATLAYVLTVAAGIIVRDWRRERARVADVVTTTRARLIERYGDEALGLADRLRAEENMGERTDA